MNKKNLFLILFFSVLCLNCSAKELKGYGNPKIGKIVQIKKVNILTEYKDDMVYPKYEVVFNLVANHTIIDLQFQSNYLFGQELNLISSKDISLNSNELLMLNKEKNCSVLIELPPLKKEFIQQDYADGELNEERISNEFKYLEFK